MSDSYKIIVEFSRSLGDDSEVVETKWPGLPLKEALIKQMVEELQEACDEGMAGMFEVTAIHLEDEAHE